MRLALRLLGALVVLAVLFVGAIFAASEFGGEVVHLRTTDAQGTEHTTHLWVVDDGGFAWLRAGHGDTGWLQRIEAHPDVVVERHGEERIRGGDELVSVASGLALRARELAAA